MVRVTEAAALASARFMGQGDRNQANNAAIKAMRHVFDSIFINGTIVVGEGYPIDTPVLYKGEVLGCAAEPEVDVALDAVESTDSVAFGRPNAIAVIALAPRHGLLSVPNVYMEKLVVGPDAAGVINITQPIEENIAAISAVRGCSPRDLTVVILDRPRHEELIERVRKTGARIHQIPDGDVSAAIAAALPGTGIDILTGIGGASEGILAAAALRCVGGEMQARFAPEGEEDLEQLKNNGITDLDKIYTERELARGDDIVFAATGVTDGDLLNGVHFRAGGAATHSLVTRSTSRTRRFIATEHYFEGKPQY